MDCRVAYFSPASYSAGDSGETPAPFPEDLQYHLLYHPHDLQYHPVSPDSLRSGQNVPSPDSFLQLLFRPEYKKPAQNVVGNHNPCPCFCVDRLADLCYDFISKMHAGDHG